MNKRIFLKSLILLLIVNTPFIGKLFKITSMKNPLKQRKSNLVWILNSDTDL